mgnify:CR=1 FL=1
MIFPYLKGIKGFFAAPVTWSLLLINMLVMVLTVKQYVMGQEKISEYISDELFLVTQGEFYAQYINYNEKINTLIIHSNFNDSSISSDC